MFFVFFLLFFLKRGYTKPRVYCKRQWCLSDMLPGKPSSRWLAPSPCTDLASGDVLCLAQKFWIDSLILVKLSNCTCTDLLVSVFRYGGTLAAPRASRTVINAACAIWWWRRRYK